MSVHHCPFGDQAAQAYDRLVKLEMISLAHAERDRSAVLTRADLTAHLTEAQRAEHAAASKVIDDGANHCETRGCGFTRAGFAFCRFEAPRRRHAWVSKMPAALKGKPRR